MSKPTEWETKKNWSSPEGELAVDVYQTEKEIVIRSTVAGVRAEELDISVDNDVLIVRGKRDKPDEESGANHFIRECYWGKFSRKIIIPDEIDPSRITASMKDGVLVIRIPRIVRDLKKSIAIKEEN